MKLSISNPTPTLSCVQQGNFDAASFDRIYFSSENYVNEADPVEPTFRERMEADVDDA